MEKVSVGIPTYNRPDGLRRTLEQIGRQTFSDLEIVVSNNASTDPRVVEVLNKAMAADSRIRVVHQPENRGIINNFLEVLRLSSSKYFMWAADDDEWDPDFIKTCYEAMISHDVGSVMTGFKALHRPRNTFIVPTVPALNGVHKFRDTMLFFNSMPHSIFYGLHRRDTLMYLVNEAYADHSLMDDEYIIVRQILEHGYLVLADRCLYVAGIDTPTYEIKLPRESEKAQFFYYKRLIHFIRLVATCDELNDLQKLEVLRRAILQKLNILMMFEKNIRPPDQYELASVISEFLKTFDVNKLKEYVELFAAIGKLK